MKTAPRDQIDASRAESAIDALPRPRLSTGKNTIWNRNKGPDRRCVKKEKGTKAKGGEKPRLYHEFPRGLARWKTREAANWVDWCGKPVGIWVEFASGLFLGAGGRAECGEGDSRVGGGRRRRGAKLGEEIKDDGEAFLDQIQIRENG